MDPVMYIFINDGLGMSPGKVAAQAAHAAVEAYRKTPQDSNLLRMWYCGGHYKKLVMQARDTEHLLTIERYLRDRGFDSALIIDEGLTEINAHTPTALGVVIVDKHDTHTNATFSTFKLLRERPEPTNHNTEGNRWLPRSLTGFLNATKARSRAS
jgi:PTH2 family peptidyl-tRNA hydrolase